MPALPDTVTDAAAALRAGSTTSVELTRAAIATAEELDDSLGVFVRRFDDTALEAAARADRELATGRDRGPLHGVPVGIKDMIACAEGPTTAQSLVLDPQWGIGKDAPVTRRLRSAGAVILGKTAMSEFGCGLPDPGKPFPIPRNPWDLARWAGGSSSGTANGVVAGIFPAGLGTDTAGSIRMPAAFCGLTGLMPTFGRVPKSGVVPFGYSLDHVGPLARSAADCAAVLTAIAGYHAGDPSCVRRPVPDYAAALQPELDGLRIGVVRADHLTVAADPALEPAFEEMVACLLALGAETVELTLPYWLETIAATLVTMAAEALAYHRADAHRWADYGGSTRRQLAQGALVSGADYVQAQRVRRVTQRALADLFAEVDAIVTPTAGTSAPRLDDLYAGGEVLDRIFGQVFTPYWDLVGNPVLAAPLGLTAEGLPLSFQVAGAPFDEATVLRVAAAYQSVTDHHRRRPELREDLA